MYALWIPIVVVNEAMVGPSTGPRKLLLTAVLFRDPRSSPPVPGLGIGVVLFVVATAVLVLPAIGRITAVLFRGRGGRAGVVAPVRRPRRHGDRSFAQCSSPSGRPSRSVRCRGCPLTSTRSERRSRS